MNSIEPATIARLIVLAIALVNQLLTSSGKNPLPFAEDTLYEAITVVLTLAVSAWAAWKNNSVTQKAIKADEYLKELKSSEEE